MEEISEIQQFYKNQTILIFGATGFIGKILIEKLLRSCGTLAKIYIVIRPKYNKSIKQRFEELLSSSCFDILKKTCPDFSSKIHALQGDCVEPFCGLSSQDQELLTQEVTICFNLTADVRLSQSLKHAVLGNVVSTKNILEFVKKIIKLKGLIYVSTAYSNFNQDHIEETFYKPPMKAESILELISSTDNKYLKAVTPALIQNWPNTYTISKCIAEDYLRREGNSIPIAICRPGVVINTIEEPYPGWIDNHNGANGPVLGQFLGLVRICCVKKTSILYLVPCDYVVNLIISIASNLPKTHTGDKQISIYNYIGSRTNFVTSGTLTASADKLKWEIPSKLTGRYPSYTITENYFYYKCGQFLYQTMFAYFTDFLLLLIGKKGGNVKMYNKINKMIDSIIPFTTRCPTMSYNNVEKLWNKMGKNDKKLFKFAMDDIDWNHVLRNNLLHGRQFMFNESIEEIPKAKKKLVYLSIIHYTIELVLCYVGYKTFSWLLTNLFW